MSGPVIHMSKTRATPKVAAPLLDGPSMVYFWGPVRDHVNRVALEYARRLHPRPVWLSIPDGAGEREALPSTKGGASFRLYSLGPEDDIAPAPSDESEHAPLAAVRPAKALAAEVGHYLKFPPAAREALEALDRRRGPAVLLLTNIDRLQHAGLLTNPERSRPLLEALRSRSITVVVTSRDLIRAPALPMECAFRVESTPEEYWSQAELWPGIPVSACTTCPGSNVGEYATCSDSLRAVCPVRLPFETAEAPST